MRAKSQAAMEFLSTYVWGFLVIILTMSALYYFGIFDFGKFLPQKCIFPSQFRCLDFSLRPSQVRIKLNNGIGEDVRVNLLQITNDANPAISCTPPAVNFNWAHDTQLDLTFSSCSGGGYLPNQRAELKITMRYYAINTPSQPNHIINGKINGRVTSS